MFFDLDIVQVLTQFDHLSKKFEHNTTSKNAFLAICSFVDPRCDNELVNKLAPFGGIIGPGDSFLHKYLKHFKILRIHAIFHDAFGFMKEEFDIGPGYVYTFLNFPNHFLLGHISGILYWSFFRLAKPRSYHKMPF